MTDEFCSKYVIPGELSLEDVRELKEAFDLLDENKSGKVSFAELRAAIIALGLSVDAASVAEIFCQSDKGENTQLTFQDFYSLATMKLKDNLNVEQVMKAFMLFDKDRTGTISVDNLAEVAHEIGKKIDRPKLQDIVNALDTDGDKEISPEEFYFILARGSAPQKR